MTRLQTPKKRRLACAAIAIAICTTPAVASGEGNAEGDGATLSEQAKPSLTVVWRRQVGSRVSPFATPGFFGDVICTVATNGEAHFTGIDGNRPIASTVLPPSTADYFATAGCGPTAIAAIDKDGVLLVANHRGEEIWKKDLRTGVVAAPRIVGRRLLTLGLDGRLSAYALRQGKPLWWYLSPLRNTLRTAVPSQPLIVNRTIYTGLNNASVVAVDLANGNVIWENIIALPLHSNFILNIQDTTAPAGNAQIVCAAAYQGGVACFDAKNGERFWNKTMSVKTNVALDPAGRLLFVSDQDGTLHAFNAYSGKALWSVETKADLSSPVTVAGAVVVGDTNGVLFAYDVNDGALLTTYPTGTGTPFTALQRLAQSDNTLIALAESGTLFRIAFSR